MENNMKFLLAVICASFVAGCSVINHGPGQVAHQKVACTSEEDCKTKLANSCPTGGVLHGVKQAVEIEYSCNQ